MDESAVLVSLVFSYISSPFSAIVVACIIHVFCRVYNVALLSARRSCLKDFQLAHGVRVCTAGWRSKLTGRYLYNGYGPNISTRSVTT